MSSFLKRLISVIGLSILLSSSIVTAAPAPVKLAQNYNQEKVNKRSLHIKFKSDSGVGVQGNDFAATDQATSNKLNSLLGRAKKNKSAPLVSSAKSDNVVAKKLSNYYKVTFDEDVDVNKVISELNMLGVVEEAYAQPLPAPSPTANFTTLQQYLTSAPTGINSNYAATIPGGDGSKTKIIDIEYGWNISHEDLIKASGAIVPNGTPSDPFNDPNHGTAVIGSMIAANNGFGITGAARGATIELINAYSVERGWDIAGALTLAAARTNPGDVIIIEQQVWGPTFSGSDFLPVEWYAEIYDAIKALTDSGRIVIEPAANGSHNLDDPMFTNGISFPMGKPDSGAIIVGAGENCAGGALRSRLSFSNYGSRVNLQGPGNCVVTTGYGDLSSASTNSLYTSYFNGTSSASPVVASAAAIVSSVYETLNGGLTMTPTQVRSLLMSTGTPQSVGTTGNIGAYPNLAAALNFTDNIPPTVPTGVRVSQSGKKLVLNWNAATDNVKVKSYVIYRNGVAYKTVDSAVLTFSDTLVQRRKSYTYSVRAVDTKGNYSAFSKSVTIIFR